MAQAKTSTFLSLIQMTIIAMAIIPNPSYAVPLVVPGKNVIKATGSLSRHTVPGALTSDLNPHEYLKLRGYNVTGLDILPLLGATQPISERDTDSTISSASSEASCPITWKVDISTIRKPQKIYRAVCNQQGTTCMSADGQPACETVSISYIVEIYLGMDSKGINYFRRKREIVPVACSCSV